MILFVTVISVLFLKVTTADDLPSYFPKCHIDDPDSCLLRGFQILKPHVSNGIEEIGLPPLNPLRVPKLKVSQTGPLARYQFLLENFTITGLDDYHIQEFRYNPHTMTFYGRIVYDTMSMTSNMDALGQVISVPIEGKGSVEVTLIGPINGEFEINGNLRNENGVNYYNTTNIKVNLYIYDGSCRLDDFFNNNIYLTRMITNIFNENSKLVVDVLTPAFKEMAKYGIRNLMTELTNRIPYNLLFPRRNY
ncbi:hypothetical protein ILUMI_24772 [Ignelater luminosus]|uniref:Uncharacterized protein n=1 Tax=Ignelater luminosus TaxID=2038154 RepID=A0A8K0G0K3_IGNLU|nr:hypothetical protein ILUMI_24772 [Ignelater luminosus]